MRRWMVTGHWLPVEELGVAIVGQRWMERQRKNHYEIEKMKGRRWWTE